MGVASLQEPIRYICCMGVFLRGLISKTVASENFQLYFIICVCPESDLQQKSCSVLGCVTKLICTPSKELREWTAGGEAYPARLLWSPSQEPPAHQKFDSRSAKEHKDTQRQAGTQIKDSWRTITLSKPLQACPSRAIGSYVQMIMMWQQKQLSGAQQWDLESPG